MRNCHPLYAFVVFFFMFCGQLFADTKGQIININQNYQIAFTDLGNNVLKQGDIVRVSINADDFVYMQVLESSPILSKLGASQLENFRTNLKDFQSMAVGNEVVKVDQAQANADVSSPVASESKDDVALLEVQIKKLEGDLASARAEVQRLEESNEESKKQLSALAVENQRKMEESVTPEQTNNKEILAQVKTHLDNIRKLINENN